MIVLRTQKKPRKVGVAIRMCKTMAATAKHNVPSDVAFKMSFESAVGVDNRRDSYNPNAEKKVCHNSSKPRKMKKFPTFTLIVRNCATETA